MKGNNITKIYDRLAGHVFSIRQNRKILASSQNPEHCFNEYLNLLMHRFMVVSLMTLQGVPGIGDKIDLAREKGNDWHSFQELFVWVYNFYPGIIFAPHPLDLLKIEKAMINELLDFLLSEANSERIIYAHEKLIGRSFCFDGDRVAVKDSHQRKNSGIFYTPPYIIKYIIKNTISQKLNYFAKDLTDGPPEAISVLRAQMKDFKILDPSSGSGVFLTAAAKELAHFYRRFHLIDLGEIPLFIAQNNIRGIDSDPIAVEFCVFNLLTALGEKNPAKSKEIYRELLKNIKIGDFLKWATKGQDSYDYVIGNPPFVSGRKILPGQKKYVRENFRCATGQFDLIIPFIEGALKLLKKKGKLCFILPNKYLAADFGYELRKNIIQNYNLEQLTDLSTFRVFKEAAVYPVIQVIGKAQIPEQKVLVSQLKFSSEKNAMDVQRQVYIPQNFFEVDNFNLSPEISPESYPVLKKIRQHKGRISSDKILCGIAKSGFSKDIFDRDKFEELSCDQGNYKRILQACDIIPYKINSNYKYISNSTSTPGKWQKFNGPKLVVPGIAKKLMAAVDLENSALGRLYFIREGTVPWDLYFLLGLLNSSVTSFYYHILFWPVHQSGGYLRMNSTYLAQIPIPDRRPEIEKAVAQLTQKFCKEWEDKRLNQMTAELDNLLAEMYGLDEKDMKFINSYPIGG